MLDALLPWRSNGLVLFEWDRLHGRRPVPLGVVPVWMGVAVFVIAVTFPGGLVPLISRVPGAVGLHGSLITSSGTPARWIHAAVFWALPWLLLERRMIYRGRSWEHLEAKTATLIRLFGYAMLAYPFLRLGFFGVSRLLYRGEPAATLIDLVLLETRFPILQRYLLAIAVAGQFAALTWLLVVARLRLAQWAAVIASKPLERLACYTATTLILTGALLALKTGLYDQISDPATWRTAGGAAHFLRHQLPWAALVSLIALLVAAAARWDAHRRAQPAPQPVGA
jgi:hypothetical protein